MSQPVFRLYDTMSRTVKEVSPLVPGKLTFYSCGPTVYSFAHIGNFRTFLTADLIVRTAQAIGWDVRYVSNITDVGHLTEDNVADSQGEDKMARALHSKDGARFNNVYELAEFYEDAFIEDWDRLNLKRPTVRPKATQHMREQIIAAEQLISEKHAYETPTGVYFSVDSFPTYGKLSGNTQEGLMDAVRNVVQDENKHKQADFALWKKDDKHLMQWFSPYGWGFPGWHLECSVMARAYLGDTIDLHGGGEDLIFPHHECEIAQSESLTGKPFCNHWVHTRFLQVNGEKMAKSAGNYYTVRDLVEKGIDPLAIRYALISGVYTKPLNFTDQGLRDAVKIIERYYDADRVAQQAASNPAGEGQDLVVEFASIYDEVLGAMLEDLNTAVALAKALEGVKLINKHRDALTAPSAKAATEFLDRVNNLLGIVRADYTLDPVQETAAASVNNAEIDDLVAKRFELKKAKDYAGADAIRAELESRGIEIQDSPTGSTWKAKVSF